MKVKVLGTQSCLTFATLCSPPGSCPQDSPGKNTGVGCHALLQGIFPTQGSKTRVSYVSYRGIQISKLGVGPETFLPKHTPPTHSLFIPAATTVTQDTTVLLLRCRRCNLTGLPTISFHMSLRVMPSSCLDPSCGLWTELPPPNWKISPNS